MTHAETWSDSADVVPSPLFAGRYTLGPAAGAGGQAVVHQAHQLAVERTVAIKVATQSSPRHAARIHREAVHLARVRHPHVVGVVEAGTERDRAYVVMDWLEGPSLYDVLCDGPLPTDRAIRLILGALDGLHALHDAGIVHRDIKPSNLVLVHAGTPAERLVIVDFGLSWSIGAQRLTQTGDLVGTPQYLAPEMAQRAVPEPATDVYQMALVLAEMLVGRPVVRESTPQACIRRHQSGVALPAGLPPELASVLGQALQRHPADRFPTARALAEALQQSTSVAPSPLVPTLAVGASLALTASVATVSAAAGALATTVIAAVLVTLP